MENISLEIIKKIKTLRQNINADHFHEHQKDFIEYIHTKVVYSNREPEATEMKTVETLYRIHLAKSIK